MYRNLPYVRKICYGIGEMADRILVRAITDESGCRDEDEAFVNFLTAIRKAGEFRDMMPASMRDEY